MALKDNKILQENIIEAMQDDDVDTDDDILEGAFMNCKQDL